MKVINGALVLFLAAIFLFAGIDKILHFQGFVNALSNYVLLPAAAAPFVAPSVIGIEILIGLGMLLRPWRRLAALTAAFTLMAFTIALAINHLYGDRSICGCWFTLTLAKGSGAHIAQNVMMCALAIMTWWDQREDKDNKEDKEMVATSVQA